VPALQLASQIGDAAILLIRQILFLTNVSSEVVKLGFSGVVEVFDQFPFSFPDRGSGAMVVVVGIVKVDRVSLQGSGGFFQNRHQAESVDGLIFRQVAAGEFNEGRKEIVADRDGR